MTGSQKLSFWGYMIGLPAIAGLTWYAGWKVALCVYLMILANNLHGQAGRIR